MLQGRLRLSGLLVMSTRLSSGKKVLVTGGAGFIGSALIYELNQRGYDKIIVSDRLSTDERYLNLVGLNFDDYIEADDLLTKIKTARNFSNEIGCIFHLGACSSTTEKDANYLIRNNYEYTKSLAHFAHDNAIRFVYASSAATYGNGKNGMSDIPHPNLSLRPLNMYGYSKHLFDIYAAKNNLHVHGMKYFNVFGPNEYHKGNMRSMVLKAYEKISATGRVELFKSNHSSYKDGEQMRDFLYVKDAVDMTIFLGEVDDRIGNFTTYGVYNLGSGIASTWKQLISPIFETLNKPANIDFIDMPSELIGKYQYYTCADISKLRSIGYDKETTKLHDAVTDYVQNYLAPGNKRLAM